jgi:hypothetical protein
MNTAPSPDPLNSIVSACKWDRLAKLFLVIIPLIIFGPALQFEFVEWDDDVNILSNPHVAGLGWEEIKWMFTDVERAHRYLPLGWLLYAIERSVWGADPFIFHLGNLVLHLVNGLLVYAILKRVLVLTNQDPEGQPVRLIAAAAVGALFWAVNPLRVEVVSWCAARIYLVATLWFLLSVWCYLRSAAVSAPVSWRRRAWLFFTLSLFTYPVALLGGFLFPLLDWLVLRRLPRAPRQWFAAETRPVWLEKAPVFALSVGWVVLMVATRNVGLERSYVDTLAIFDVPHRLMQGVFGLVYFLWKPWLPVGLAPKYGNLIEFSPLEAPFLLSAAAAVGLTVICWACRLRWPALLGAWLAHLLFFLPFIGLSEYPHSLYDRYTYAAGIVWALWLGIGLWQIWPWAVARKGVLMCSAAVLCGFALLSSSQTLIWQNTATVRLCVAESLKSDPSRSEHEEIAGLYFFRKGNLEQAVFCFRQAILHDPANLDARIELGNALAVMGREDEALQTVANVAQQRPASLVTRLNLGVALCKLDRLEQGLAIFREILQEEPNHESARHNLVLALEKLGRSEEAERIRNSSTNDSVR